MTVQLQLAVLNFVATTWIELPCQGDYVEVKRSWLAG